VLPRDTYFCLNFNCRNQYLLRWYHQAKKIKIESSKKISISDWIDCSLAVRNLTTKIHSRPASSTAFWISLASSCSSKYEMTIDAPSRANAKATARPIPESPPYQEHNIIFKNNSYSYQ
jgi:hypothetical protein